MSGKSTLTSNLIKSLKERGLTVRYGHNSLLPANPIAIAADQLRKETGVNRLATGALFTASHLYDNSHFTYPAIDTIHVQDSCFLRTLAFHKIDETVVVENTKILDLITSTVVPFIPIFDTVIFLKASI